MEETKCPAQLMDIANSPCKISINVEIYNK